MASDEGRRKEMEYSGKFQSANRFSNLDGIEAKVITHLIDSTTSYAQDIWRLLKYAEETALSKPPLSKEEKEALVFTGNNGVPDATKQARVFLAPYVDDAWKEQGSSLYVYVSEICPLTVTLSEIVVNFDIVVHSQTSVVLGNGDPALNPNANPNDSDKEGNLVVSVKNRATTLLKDVLAEFNGICLDGVGYMFLNDGKKAKGGVKVSLWNRGSFYGNRVSMVLSMSGISGTPDVGY
jgi:hypothetical protein